MTHVADVVIQSSEVPSDQTDFVVYIDLSSLFANAPAFKSTVANGGGDIRCYKSDGTTELAREVVSCDTATDTGVLHVKFTGTLSSSSNTTIQIHTGGGSEPAADSTYGSEAVWSALSLMSHSGETDSTDNNTISERNVTAGNATGPLGDATSFNGTNEALGFSQVSSDLSGGTEFSIRGWVNFDSMASGAVFAIWLDSSTYQVLIAPTDTDEILVAIGTGAGQVRIDKTTAANLSTGTDYLLEVVLAGPTDVKVYINGVSQTTTNVVNQSVNTVRTVSETMGVGGRWTQNNDYCDVTVSEMLVSTSARSADWIETEYNNQSSPGTFYTVSAVSGDTTAPILTSPTASSTGETTASGSVSTDEANGTLYWVVTTSGTAPSAAQVQAGQDNSGTAAAASGSQSVSATGSQAISPTGLTADTTYTIHYQHEDAAGNDSTVVSSSSFTTDASATFSIALSIKVNTLL